MTSPRFKPIWIIMLMTALFLVPACSGKDKDAAVKKPEMSSQKTMKAPKEMQSILSDLEMFMTNLEQKIKKDETSALQQNTMMTPSNQAQQKEQQGQQEQKKPEEDKEKSSATSQESQMDSWQKEASSIKSLHKNWNKLEPEAIKAGLSIADRNNFEKALETLTLETSKQKKEASLLAAIELYGQYPNLVKLFDTPIPPEFFIVKYEIISSAFEASQLEWKLAQQRIPKIQENWNHLKVKAKSKDEKLMSRIEFSIQDLEQAINGEQLNTLMVKTEIVMNNLQQLEKELSAMSFGTSQ